MLGASKRQRKRRKEARRGCERDLPLWCPSLQDSPTSSSLFHSAGGTGRMSGINEGPYSAMAFATHHLWPRFLGAAAAMPAASLGAGTGTQLCFLVRLDLPIHQPLGHQKGFLIFLEPRSKQGPYG